MAAAFSPSKGGFVREALTHSYPRLAALLEQTLQRILTDTQVGGAATPSVCIAVAKAVYLAHPFPGTCPEDADMSLCSLDCVMSDAMCML